jgi:hypothetical protein
MMSILEKFDSDNKRKRSVLKRQLPKKFSLMNARMIKAQTSGPSSLLLRSRRPSRMDSHLNRGKTIGTNMRKRRTWMRMA